MQTIKKVLAGIVLVLATQITVWGQNNSCVEGSGTNCTSGIGDPFIVMVSEPTTGWPYACVGEEMSITATPSTNLPGVKEITTTNEDCSITNVLDMGECAIITNWWAATGDPYTGSGTGSNAVFTPTNCGTETVIFYMTYWKSRCCGGGSNMVAMTNSYSVIGVASLVPTIPTNFTLVSSNSATLQTFSIPVSTNPAVTNLEIAASACPSLDPTNLPNCWSLNEERTNITYVLITAPGVFTVICSAGTSAITNIIWVVGTECDVEQNCGTNAPTLLGYWSFNNNLTDWWSGNSNANDSIGTNNGTVSGTVTYASGPWGVAFDFPSAEGSLTFPTNVADFGTNNFALDFWMQTTAQMTNGVGQTLMIGGSWVMDMTTNGNIAFEPYDSGTGHYEPILTSYAQVNDGNFHDVTLSRNSYILTIYVDGELDSATNTASVLNLPGGGLQVGAYYKSGFPPFIGLMQNITLSTGLAGPWVGNLNQQPLAEYGLQNPLSPWGDALKIDTNVPANLSYAYAENDGLPNINCINGAVSFWFKPDWNGGAGPGNPGRFLEIGDTNSTNGWWSLWVDGGGSNLYFQSQSNSVLTTYFTQPITNWSSNDWYQLVLDYSTNDTGLYINGVLATNGGGMTNYPTIPERMAYGFSVGSDHDGTNQIRGTIDELTTYACPLTTPEVTNGYPGTNEDAGPWIITQPVSQTVADGSSITFDVTAIGAPPLSYQWKLNGNPISGGTLDSLVIAPVAVTNGGSYTVVVTNITGNVTSLPAILIDTSAADPNNPSDGILTITIVSPAQGAIIH